MVVLRGDWGGSFEMGWGGSFVKEFVVVVFNSSTNPGRGAVPCLKQGLSSPKV